MEINKSRGKAGFEAELVKLGNPIFPLKKGLTFTVKNENRSSLGVLSRVTHVLNYY